jgi:hypothetical protein
LEAVDGTGSGDIWAVGWRTTVKASKTRSVILHYDGTSWRHVVSPEAGALLDVAADSPDDAWAVGRDVLHWNGRRWRAVDIPTRGRGLFAVAATSPDDVWIGGLRDREGPGYNTLIEHWDGSTWTVTPSPNPGRHSNSLMGLVALSPSDVWAGGYKDPGTLSMTLHWNGRRWSVVPSPDPGDSYNVYWGIGDDGAGGGVWAVGHYGDKGGHTTALVSRWTGSGWEQLTPRTFVNWSPTAASGTSPDDMWIIGSEPTSTLVIAHWNGRSLDVVVAPEAEGRQAHGILDDVFAAAPDDAWAVGWSTEIRAHHEPALLMHWDGSEWRSVEAPRLGPIPR